MSRRLIALLFPLLAAAAHADSGRADYDLDDDGLIEINDLADLDEIRNNLDGSSLYGSSNGCPADGCVGFELTTDLDFDTNGDGVLDDYWNDGAGWESIGESGNSFESVFEGNGHVIRNLYIDRSNTNYQGLFGRTENARVQNIGLAGPLMSISGDRYVGALVGYSSSTIIEGVFSTGSVQGDSYSVGGLVGTLAGEGQIRAAFSTGSVISDSYYVGGLVGDLDSGEVHSSYATGFIEGARDVGGLVGDKDYSDGSVTASYWATDLSGHSESDGGVGALLSELRCPVSASNDTCTASMLYELWGEIKDSEGNAYWDFGNEQQLPALVLAGKTYRDSDGDGVLDEKDAFPLSFAASSDADADGHPGAWHPTCDNTCSEASALVLDHLPNNAAAAIDTDLDGLPEEWNSDCDHSCQDSSGLTLDAYHGDVDNDGVLDSDHPRSDGLIEIQTLENLNAIRYSLKGAGRRVNEEDDLDVTGCPPVVYQGTLQRRCRGYELTQDLDFDTNGDGVMNAEDDYWNDGAGWESIGEGVNPFEAVFDGNGYVIRNLYIDRPTRSYQGLFGRTENARIQNVGLTGSLMSISGDRHVGALVGYSNSTIIEGVFSTGSVQGGRYGVGGLVGALAGDGQIKAAFSTGSVTSDSYSVGGLVGIVQSGTIRAAYATGIVDGTTRVGGLVGDRYGSSGSVAASYWATDLSGQPDSDGGVGAELSELLCPLAGDDETCSEFTLYEQWGEVQDSEGNVYWGFGTNAQLPALFLSGKTYRDSDGDGALDEDDVWPFNPEASRDADGDGHPDAWSLSCDTECRDASSLVLDQFPNHSAAAVDSDLDGMPDKWNSSCDQSCQDTSGLTLDTQPSDADNDGVADSEHPHANGLVNIDSLAQLHAIRYSLEGVGRRMSAEEELDTTGCPIVIREGTAERRCHGYELTQDLDFDTNGDGAMNAQDDYWNEGSGWEGIGESGDSFETVFEGNGHVIRNLYIDRSGTSYQGLFGRTENARIQNIGLAGPLMSVRGNSSVGALVGYSSSTIIEGAFSTGSVQADGYYAGGLVGYLTGESQIRAAFSTGSVTSDSYSVGGLVGRLYSGQIQAAYATGIVDGTGSVGGLVGEKIASYGSVTASYWAIDLSGQAESAGGVGASLSELKCPVAADDAACSESTLYEQWGEIQDMAGNAYWDFGTDVKLPALVLAGNTYRDGDNDGVLDTVDAFPASPAASVDLDGDDFPDRWHAACDAECRDASGLVLDQFPNHSAAAVDGDLDGLPDEWNSGCDQSCQGVSGLILDTHPGDVDNDGIADSEHPHANGLISIDSLAQLHAIRYSMEGVGRRMSAEDDLDTTGCPIIIREGTSERRCHGYELTQDLDFDTNGDGVMNAQDDYWNEGYGWDSIGENGNSFEAVFQGNGHVIRNLYIDRSGTSYQGLFGRTENARIQNIGLAGPLMSVRGNSSVGALVGYSSSTIIEGAFSTGSVQGDGYNAGGLVGYLTGEGRIEAAFSTGSVTSGSYRVGGLVGSLDSGEVHSSYATGIVDGLGSVGGLVGDKDSSDGFVTISYWTTDLSRQPFSDGGAGAGLSELKCPVAADDATCSESTLYEQWGETQDPEGNVYWEFGTNQQLPALILAGRAYRDSDGDGALDEYDAFPASLSASTDTDGDGYPERLHVFCDTECYDASGLTIDQFPNNSAAAVDNDLDGSPDEWSSDCDQSCQNSSGLTLDTHPGDADNDGVSDSEHPHVNGLINIDNLEQLHAIRYSLEGLGRRVTAESELDTTGCPIVVLEGTLGRRCYGYELTQDLDFDTNGDGVMNALDDYWNDGAGWESIGEKEYYSETVPFEAVFEGNGHVIRNLYIDRSDTRFQGLFAVTHGARIQNVGLTGSLMNIKGRSHVGSLVGDSESTIIEGVFSTGSVRSEGNYVGGLIGYLSEESKLRAAFSTGLVSGGSSGVGGLVGRLDSDSGIVQSSYATGQVLGGSGAGGLIGSFGSSSGSVEASYWATDSSDQTESAGGEGTSLSELQCPLAADDETCSEFTLYAQWSEVRNSEGVAYWDFGTDAQLPALVLAGRVYRDSDSDGGVDEEDVWPFNPEVSRDADGDGHPDAWSLSCDSDCRDTSSLVLDQLPNNSAASVDADLDGLPDEWNGGCDQSCQNASGLTLDTHPGDADNDGVADSEHPHANGLISVDSLAQLHAIRYSMGGVGRRMSAGGELDTTGCPIVIHEGTSERRCHGYELTLDLDFDTNGDGVMDEQDDYWNDGDGWQSIGENGDSFEAVFEGNGHLIHNLYIDRSNTNYQGLFGHTENARIQNVGLTGALMNISGDEYVGALVGYSYSTVIEGVFSTGSVQGYDSDVGGLVGFLSGEGQIRAAFSTGPVTNDSSYTGGLVGRMYAGKLQSAYATGIVEGAIRAGGLVGGKDDADGFVSASYWATDLSAQAESDGGVGAALSELKCPVAADDVTCSEAVLYEQWGEVQDSAGGAYWDFGTSEQLPALVLAGKTYRDGDSDRVLDSDDAFPVSPAASVDIDGDGSPDLWHASCGVECRDASGLVLDQFPNHSAAAVDGDLDGLPDGWNVGCDQSCQDSSGLTLDTHPGDADNDGVADSAHPHANGLINIDSLAQLHAIRYSLEGVGRRMSAEGELDTTGCPILIREGTAERRCHGYELTQDLDFDTNSDGVMNAQDDYWNDGAGWESIGNDDDPFHAVFQGNGHVIRNLYMNRINTSYQGLFGGTEDARIQNVGLTGPLMSIKANTRVGALVGYASSTVIEGVFNTGSVQGNNYGVGGLVGYLTGESYIRAAFSTGSVTSDSSGVGGLIGGLDSGEVHSSYATGFIEGSNSVGGLVGDKDDSEGSVTASYWATDLSGHSESDGGIGALLSELQCPVSASNATCAASTLYEQWGEIKDSEGNAYWDFGTEQQLPALVVASKTYRDSDGDGVLDEEDAFPLSPAASNDTDADGHPDAWNLHCDNACREASSLVLDQFPNNTAAAIDTDLDGLPEEWNSDCDQSCQINSGLTLDAYHGDADNDGVLDSNHPHSDGLIDIETLDDLYAIRYSLEGIGRRMSEGGDLDVTGCPPVVYQGTLQRRCHGYELTQDLDFDTNGDGVMNAEDDYWNEGAGWESIGEIGNSFESVFEGNGHVIRNLYIDRFHTSYQGLFGRTENARIQNLGLTGSLMSISGDRYVGALAGSSSSTIIEGVFSTGSARGERTRVGGLVGSLAGESQIRAAFSTGSVTTDSSLAGGLVGYLYSGKIQASYATGNVDGTSRVGGLVGDTYRSYGSVTASYWATDLSHQSGSNGGVGADLSELLCPVVADNETCSEFTLYEQWGEIQDSEDNVYWDFGTNAQLPALVLAGKTYRDSDGDGALDEDDVWPFNSEASRDADGDGHPDAWSLSCDTECRNASSLVLDQFPNHSAAAVDSDLDGLPDEWNGGCDQSCQDSSGLTLDAHPGDADDDGVSDSEHPHANGLISIDSLAQLHAIRYSMEGVGRRMNAEDELDTTGCPVVLYEGISERRCHGYELTKDLDFDTNGDGVMNAQDDYWNDGAGWESIGESGNSFQTVFEGNGHVIHNLYIDRSGTSYQGLFGRTENARIQNIGLTGPLMRISGGADVGALVGVSDATTIEGVFSSGPVHSESSGAGGLVGYFTGESQLRAAFSTGSVTSGSYRVGGLVGELYSGELHSSYATGVVEGAGEVGGLVGYRRYSASVASSYWATDHSGQSESEGGVGVELSELQCPLAADDHACSESTLYYQWGQVKDSGGNAYWNFGTERQLPALILAGKVYRDSDSDGGLDAEDVWPFNPEASRDADGDGHPDAWSSACDSACRDASNLALDQLPNHSAAAVDGDLDGLPDEWNSGCDQSCQDASGLTLDTHPGDVDNDGVADSEHPHANGLINIDSLAQLHAIRYSMDGVGRRMSAEDELDTTGCPIVIHDGTSERRCHGYELTQDLDFDTNGDGVMNAQDDYWNEGSGWESIGHYDVHFRAVFQGNGHVIRNLYINRPEEDLQGLFGRTMNARIQNVGLTGLLMSVAGDYHVGALIGGSEATTIEGVFSTGTVHSEGYYAGGLVGYITGGGLLRAAFSTSSVTGNSYNVGGLVGNLDSGELRSSYATGQVEGRGYTGGLAGDNGYDEGVVETSYWATDLSGQSESAGGGIGVPLSELKCPVSADNMTCAAVTLYEQWGQVGDAQDNAYWNFGTEQQLPALVLAGKVYRDSDSDGVLDHEDGIPLNAAASVDADQDGLPDIWREGCGTDCQDNSGLTLDKHLNDTDNDGVVNDQDAFPANPAATVDADEDGLPDEWLNGCDSNCQESSGLTLDARLNFTDSDSDGVVNDQDHYPTDPDRWQDDVAPEMVLVPAPMHVASTGELTEVTLNVEDAGGYDSFSASVSFRVYYDEERLEWDDQYRIELPVGKAILNWVAVDSAGNESAPMPQEVNVYPQVSFTESESVTGENNAALVKVSLTGPSPVYPITLKAQWVEADSTANAEDVLTNGDGSVDLNELTTVIESEEELTDAGFIVPFVQDDQPEMDEQLVLTLQAAYAGEQADDSESEESRFVMPLIESSTGHTLTITDANLAPTLALSIKQGGESVQVVRQDGGEVTVEARITDANGGDEHQLEWYTSDLPFVVSNAEHRFTFDPMDLDVGDYTISALVTDNGNPALSSQEVTLAWQVEMAGSGGETGEENEEGGSGGGLNGDAGSGGSGGGHVSLWLLMALFLMGCSRQRAIHRMC